MLWLVPRTALCRCAMALSEATRSSACLALFKTHSPSHGDSSEDGGRSVGPAVKIVFLKNAKQKQKKKVFPQVIFFNIYTT